MNEESGMEEIGRGIMSVVVRLLGLTLLLAGLWIAFHVLLEAYHLYQEPQRIERFAVAIEKGSNIDKSLVTFRDSTLADEDETTGTKSLREETMQSPGNVRVSYFFAWMIVLLLLLLIGRISLAAIKTGGELVLYDVQIKHFAKTLVRETGRRER